jgi:hypothetical protein
MVINGQCAGMLDMGKCFLDMAFVIVPQLSQGIDLNQLRPPFVPAVVF